MSWQLLAILQCRFSISLLPTRKPIAKTKITAAAAIAMRLKKDPPRWRFSSPASEPTLSVLVAI